MIQCYRSHVRLYPGPRDGEFSRAPAISELANTGYAATEIGPRPSDDVLVVLRGTEAHHAAIQNNGHVQLDREEAEKLVAPLELHDLPDWPDDHPLLERRG